MSKSNLPTVYSQFIHLSRYARWMESKGRRETWEETVDRYINFMFDIQCAGKVPKEVRDEIRSAILNLEVMPSMRCLMTAGEALKIDHVAGYNCSTIAINHPFAFDELLYLLMCLAPDTLIKTRKGDKPISEITKDDEVLSLSSSGEYEYVKPSFIGETPSSRKKKIELEMENGHIIRVTDDHRFLTKSRGWVKAKDLSEDDEIVNFHEV